MEVQEKEKSKRKIFEKTAESIWGYRVLCGFLLLCTGMLIAATAFCAYGTLFLIRENILQMDDAMLRQYQEERGAKAAYMMLMDDGVQSDIRILIKDVPENANLMGDERTQQVVCKCARQIMEDYLESEDPEITQEFCEKYLLEYSIYHYQGRRLCGNLSVYEEDRSWTLRVLIKEGSMYRESYYVKLRTEYADDMLYSSTNAYAIENVWIENQIPVVAGLAAGLILSGAGFYFLEKLAAARGRKKQSVLRYIPLEGVLAVLGWYLSFAFKGYLSDNMARLKEMAVMLLGVIFLVLLAFVHVRRRLEENGWYKRSVCYLLYLLGRKIVRSWCGVIRELSIVWKFLLFLMGISAAELCVILLLVPRQGAVWLLTGAWAAEKLVLLPVILKFGSAISKLGKAASEISSGNLEYRVEENELPKIFRNFGHDMNEMAGSVGTAVEEQMRSERMKTELITNVSHDIKTPLTSIINFSDLIGKEKTENPRITEYASLLHKQSSRLKKLIDDLMEVSKASTGNMEIHLEPCNVKTLMGQCLGEFQPRLEENGLELIVKQEEKLPEILADQRMLWRIFENLMNNICKYAQKETRVYLSTEADGEQLKIIFKNTSRYALDISPEELMERFVRGDLSRHTEGHGLGLSIVGSLMELQGGRLSLMTDGDLFKAILTFPLPKTAAK